MVGQITFRGGRVLALEDDGSLRCDDEEVQKTAELFLEDYRRGYSVADGTYGYGFLKDMAALLKGQLEMEEKAPRPPGTVY